MGKNFVAVKSKYFKNSNVNGVLGHVNRVFKENVNAFAQYTENNFGTPDLLGKYNAIQQQVETIKGKKQQKNATTLIDSVLVFSLDRFEELEKELPKEEFEKIFTDKINEYMQDIKKKYGLEPIGFQMHLDEGHEKNELIRNVHAHLSFYNFDMEKKKAPWRDMKKKDYEELQNMAGNTFESLGFQRGISKQQTKKRGLDKDAFIAEKQAKLEAENNELKQSNDGLRADNEQLAIKNSNLTTVNADLRQKLEEVRETGKKAKKDLLKLGEKGKETIEDIKDLREKYNNDADDYRSLKEEKKFISEDIEILETEKLLKEKDLNEIKKKEENLQNHLNILKVNIEKVVDFVSKLSTTFVNLINIEKLSSSISSFDYENRKENEMNELNNNFKKLKRDVYGENDLDTFTPVDKTVNEAIKNLEVGDSENAQLAKNTIRNNIDTTPPPKKKSTRKRPGLRR